MEKYPEKRRFTFRQTHIQTDKLTTKGTTVTQSDNTGADDCQSAASTAINCIQRPNGALTRR